MKSSKSSDDNQSNVSSEEVDEEIYEMVDKLITFLKCFKEKRNEIGEKIKKNLDNESDDKPDSDDVEEFTRYFDETYEITTQLINEMSAGALKTFKYSAFEDPDIKTADFLRSLNLYGELLPPYIPKDHAQVIEGVGGIPYSKDSILAEDDFVVAYINNMWCLGMVKQCKINTQNSELSTYFVVDVEDRERPGSWHLRDKLTPLPKYKADPICHSHALFDRNTIVIAMYPQTTCFFKAIVLEKPTRSKDKYVLTFENDASKNEWSEQMIIPQAFVLAYDDKISYTPKKSIRHGDRRIES
ncbi:SAGA-associated factor 29 homolog [Strongyloides ratti]|uniref:SAGA-associated factor 29 homolog n=1 Tax=Strongyloides ratti TaxID=34506 RepID=A0A090MX06_STRRB|nr:SAGA-associated factor 29 homolog [Strongyloides ratti]CEF64599.1 SAGA-associated factor 29 homolog [Strongyloides ratti]